MTDKTQEEIVQEAYRALGDPQAFLSDFRLPPAGVANFKHLVAGLLVLVEEKAK